MKINYSKDVKDALVDERPVLALESTIISHGMPYPENMEFAKRAESICRDSGVTPATIAIINGNICVGLTEKQLLSLAQDSTFKKVSKRELGIAIAESWNGATTVSSTMHIAHQAGISVFATGGIGGIHRGVEHSFDISQDITALSQIPIVVVSAGAKAILDLQKTVEMMETLGITVLGYGTEELPAFYSRKSGVIGIHSVNSPVDVVKIHLENQECELNSATLVANPIPKDDEIPKDELDDIIEKACELASSKNIDGKELTPFLLKEISEQTKGESLRANKALALNNVRLGINITKAMT